MANIKPNELYAQWRTETFKPVYLLAGEETFLHDEALPVSGE